MSLSAWNVLSGSDRTCRDNGVRRGGRKPGLAGIGLPGGPVRQATRLTMLAAFELIDPALKPIFWPMVESDLFAPWMVSVEELEAGFARVADPSNPWARFTCADGNL